MAAEDTIVVKEAYYVYRITFGNKITAPKTDINKLILSQGEPVGTKDTESDSGLRCRTGLGDDVKGDILTLDDIHHVCKICCADGITAEKDDGALSYLLGCYVSERMIEELDNCSCSEVRSADTDNNQYIGISPDLLSGLSDTRELFLIVVGGKVEPAEEIISGAVLLVEHVMSNLYLRFHSLDCFFTADERKYV